MKRVGTASRYRPNKPNRNRYRAAIAIAAPTPISIFFCISVSVHNFINLLARARQLIVLFGIEVAMRINRQIPSHNLVDRAKKRSKG